MARITIENQEYQIDAAIFDKDGTLIDFDHVWGRRTHQAMDTLIQHMGESEALRQSLFAAWGYDPVSRRTIPDGPLAVASTAKLYTIAAAVLYQAGYGWETSERLVQEVLSPVILAPLTADLIRPLGDVAGLFEQLRQVDVSIAVVTSDDRAATQSTLALMGIDTHVSMLICGDDDLPNKPAPDGIYHASASFKVPADRIMMVGDSVSDMRFGRNGGVACCIGVYGSSGDKAALEKHADAVIETVDSIAVG